MENSQEISSLDYRALFETPGPFQREETGDYLCQLAWEGKVFELKEYLQKGFDPNVTNMASFTPLHCACEFGKLGCVAVLLKFGARINKINRIDGLAGLHWAAKNGHVEVVKLLVANGANPTLSDNGGLLPGDSFSEGVDPVRAKRIRQILQKARANWCNPQKSELLRRALDLPSGGTPGNFSPHNHTDSVPSATDKVASEEPNPVLLPTGSSPLRTRNQMGQTEECEEQADSWIWEFSSRNPEVQNQRNEIEVHPRQVVQNRSQQDYEEWKKQIELLKGNHKESASPSPLALSEVSSIHSQTELTDCDNLESASLDPSVPKESLVECPKQTSNCVGDKNQRERGDAREFENAGSPHVHSQKECTEAGTTQKASMEPVTPHDSKSQGAQLRELEIPGATSAHIRKGSTHSDILQNAPLLRGTPNKNNRCYSTPKRRSRQGCVDCNMFKPFPQHRRRAESEEAVPIEQPEDGMLITVQPSLILKQINFTLPFGVNVNGDSNGFVWISKATTAASPESTTNAEQSTEDTCKDVEVQSVLPSDREQITRVRNAIAALSKIYHKINPETIIAVYNKSKEHCPSPKDMLQFEKLKLITENI